jgi:hypothetical protein
VSNTYKDTSFFANELYLPQKCITGTQGSIPLQLHTTINRGSRENITKVNKWKRNNKRSMWNQKQQDTEQHTK